MREWEEMMAGGVAKALVTLSLATQGTLMQMGSWRLPVIVKQQPRQSGGDGFLNRNLS